MKNLTTKFKQNEAQVYLGAIGFLAVLSVIFAYRLFSKKAQKPCGCKEKDNLLASEPEPTISAIQHEKLEKAYKSALDDRDGAYKLLRESNDALQSQNETVKMQNTKINNLQSYVETLESRLNIEPDSETVTDEPMNDRAQEEPEETVLENEDSGEYIEEID